MTTVLLIAALVVGSGLAAKRWGLLRPVLSPRDQVDAFTRARAVTSNWSANPDATPAPLKEYIASQRRSTSSERAPD